jgi:hypothetical protein
MRVPYKRYQLRPVAVKSGRNFQMFFVFVSGFIEVKDFAHRWKA